MSTQRVGQRKAHRGGWLAITMAIGGRPRTFAPQPWLCLVLALVLPLLGVWYLGATVYVVFHDQLLASLITRQTDMQYAYEDRIAGLRTQLDRETSRGLVDRQTMETTVHDLQERSALLESRAATIDRLVARDGKAEPAGAATQPATKAKLQPIASRNPLLQGRAANLPLDVRAYDALPATTPLRLDGDGDRREAPPARSDPDKRADLSQGVPVAAMNASIADSLARAAGSQDHTLVALRDPMLRTVARMKTALAELGLPASIVPAQSRDVGGPFVPLPSGAIDFEQNAALLQDALVQADRLSAVVAKVPIRKPLTGPLEVTSTFGARIDPFLGRPAMHTGVDFRETYGEAVHATAGGTVTIAGSDGGYGTMVEVDHGNGLATRYAHLSSVSVAPGQSIAVGAIVGHVGSTGRATGPHLHYETRINGEPVDPTRFLRVGSRLFDN